MVLAAPRLALRRARTGRPSVRLMWLDEVSYQVSGAWYFSEAALSRWALNSLSQLDTVMIWLKNCWKQRKTRTNNIFMRTSKTDQTNNIFMQTGKTLIRLGKCWSEYLLGAQVVLLVLSCCGSFYNYGNRVFNQLHVLLFKFATLNNLG